MTSDKALIQCKPQIQLKLKEGDDDGQENIDLNIFLFYLKRL